MTEGWRQLPAACRLPAGLATLLPASQAGGHLARLSLLAVWACCQAARTRAALMPVPVLGGRMQGTWPTGIQAPLMDVGEFECLDYVYVWTAPDHEVK